MVTLNAAIQASCGSRVSMLVLKSEIVSTGGIIESQAHVHPIDILTVYPQHELSLPNLGWEMDLLMLGCSIFVPIM